jgi:E3 ubiquitin-protein ligase SIAH1
MLRDHLRDAHAWPVDKIRYGRPHNVCLSESQPRRLLELDAEEDDGRVFFVSVGARGATVACVRTAAAAGPQFSCKMWATGNPGPATGRVEMAIVEADVPSISSVPGDAAARDAVPLLVPRRMLHGASMEMHLSVRIEKAPE